MASWRPALPTTRANLNDIKQWNKIANSNIVVVISDSRGVLSATAANIANTNRPTAKKNNTRMHPGAE
jgi:hypothetical protein